MVDVSSWSETPASNTTIDGINIAENCSPGVLNNAIRSLMAGVRTFYAYALTLASQIATKADKSAAVFSGTQPIYTGEGAFYHNATSANSSGKITFLTEGSPDPAGSAGDIAIFYAP